MIRLLAVLTIVLALATPALSNTSYYSFTDDHPWLDQPGIPGSNLCWANADANALAWAGWSVQPTLQATFDVYANNFPWQGNYVDSTMRWYFDRYWPTIDVNAYWDGYESLTTANIEKAVNDREAAMIFIPSHVLNLWGYELNDQGSLVAVYVTNSAVGGQLNTLDRWTMAGNNFTYIATLDQKPPDDELQYKAPYVPPDSPPAEQPPIGVPEPGAWMLILMGVPVILIFRTVES
jgi:hypothetical protein